MDNIGGPAQFTYQEAIAKGAVEKGIHPLCDILFAYGAAPLSSCEGHPVNKKLFNLSPFKRDSVRPFVLFSRSEDKARLVNSAITEQVGTWYVHGYFPPMTDVLVWIIEPMHNDYKLGKVDRHRIDNDINALVNAISKNI